MTSPGLRHKPLDWSRLELELNSREQSLNEIGSALSHDLQEPVRNVRSFAKLLSARLGDTTDPDVSDMLGFLESAADELGARFHQLVLYSRQQTRPRQAAQPISSNSSLEAAVRALDRRIAEAGATLVWGDLPEVEIGDDALTRLFSQLLDNSLNCRSERPLKISVSAQWRHGLWQFAVSDNGIGIEPRLHERAFQLFRQVHNERSGEGVGLTFCRKTVERSGGRMWLASRAEQGCSIVFTLPGPASDVVSHPIPLRAVTW